MRIAFLTCILLLAAGAAAAQKSNVAGYRIRHQQNGVVTVFSGGRAHRLDLRGRADAARVAETELYFAAARGGERFLVLAVSGPSRARSNDRQCGAGTESNLVWLRLDAGWRIRDAQSVRYESCWSTIDFEPFEATAEGLAVQFENFRENLRVTVSYDARAPEKGLRVDAAKSAEK